MRPTATKPISGLGILFTLLAAGAGCSSSGVKSKSTGGGAGAGGVVGAGGSTGGLPGTGGAAGTGGGFGTGGALGTGGATSTSFAPGTGGAVGTGGIGGRTSTWPIPGTGSANGTGGVVGSGGTTSVRGSGGSSAACVGDTSNLGVLGFQATPAVIAPGQSSTLSWYWSTAPSLTIDQGIGMVMGKGSQVVSPAQTTTYTLTQAMSADLKLQDKVTVVVTEKGFRRTGSLMVGRSKHTATLLADGRVIVVGGSSLGQALASAEVYDPVAGTFSSAKAMARRRVGHTATLLANGKVLLVGGRDESGVQASAEIYDPVSQGFAPTGNPTVARESHTATLLVDGKVLIAGGTASSGELTSAELYDPAAGTFSAVGAMTVGRYEHAAALLAGGKVLLLGGNVPPANLSGNEGLASAELYDPATATFTATGDMTTKRAAPVIALLGDGTILVGGGGHGFEGYSDSNMLELYDSATGMFSATGNLAVKRALFSMTLLADGSVLMAGGLQHHNGSADSYLANAEIYTPAARTSMLAACMSVERHLHTATLLADGRVLVVGGRRSTMDLADAELY